MPRKPAIFLFVLLLLLSLGGAVAYPFVRKDAAPTFTEVDRYMRLQFPEVAGCTFRDHIAEPPQVVHPNGWWNHLGIDRQLEVRRDIYTFDNLKYGTYAKIAIGRTGEKIISFQVTSSFQELTVALKKIIFLKYPKLQEEHLPYR